jgi:hypothetical protein
MVLEAGYTIGLSPDGLVGDDGGIEIKAPDRRATCSPSSAARYPPEHMAQIQAALLVSGRAWWDFVSFKGGMRLWVKRVLPDPDWFRAIHAAVSCSRGSHLRPRRATTRRHRWLPHDRPAARLQRSGPEAMTEQVTRVTIEKKTDQLNFEDFLGGVTRLVTITGVKRGTKEQQYDISIEGDDRVWRPAVTVLKQLVEAWTDEASTWVGHQALLYGDPTVKFGNDKVGGIRVSHVSHIDGPKTASLTITRGKRGSFTLNPLTDAMVIAGLRAEWKTANPERRTVIEAEVAKLSGRQPAIDPGDVATPEPNDRDGAS